MPPPPQAAPSASRMSDASQNPAQLRQPHQSGPIPHANAANPSASHEPQRRGVPPQNGIHGEPVPPRSMAELARGAAANAGELSDFDTDAGLDDAGLDDAGFDDAGFDDAGFDKENSSTAAGGRGETFAAADADENYDDDAYDDDAYPDELIDEGDWEPESAFEPEVNEALAKAATNTNFGNHNGRAGLANDSAAERGYAKGQARPLAGANGHGAAHRPMRAEQQLDDWDEDLDSDFEPEVGAAEHDHGRFQGEPGLVAHRPGQQPNLGGHRQTIGPDMALAGKPGGYRSRLLAGWLALFAIIVIVGATAVLGRNTVARILPGAAAVYSSLGFAVNPHGLVIENVGYKWATDDKGRPALEVVGEIRNVTPAEVSVPNVVFALLDDQNAELFHWAVPVARRPLGAGRSSRFKTRIPSPPDAVRGLEVRFAKLR